MNICLPFGLLVAYVYQFPWDLVHPKLWRLSNVVEEVYGFIRILAEEVPSTHGLQELFHGRGHSILEVVYQHPSVKAMVRACTDGFKIPFPALIKIFTVMSCKDVDLPLQIVGLVCTEELLQKFCLQLCPVLDGPWP